MDTQKLKELAQQEVNLRGCSDHNETVAWAKAVRELRNAVPDWSSLVLDLISDNEQLKADVVALELKCQHGKEGF